ncbi:gamma subclass chorismate mutase AroQ [Calothrix sp. PCC 7507]|uniref:gamma subclass chorismate mutase AroQ n=1 Tax=Calothrix sp. PCC 7507 TaxID=99598 RepID=UPI00135F1A11|nr:gamma subclass chorismate mutase AroQ [Calothrix sp. PCC 7507]
MNLNFFRNHPLFLVIVVFLGLFFTSALVAAKLKYSASQNSRLQIANPQAITIADQQLRVDRLLKLIQQRSLIAHDVARWKWNQKRPIEDPKREQELLSKVRQQAKTYSLEPTTVAAFFQAQIEAGKLIQKADFQNWQKQDIKSFPNVPDLNQILRPSLDKLNIEFFSALADLTPVLGCPQIREIIQSRSQVIIKGEGIDQKVQSLAIAPLLKFQGADCKVVFRLDQPRDTPNYLAWKHP